MKKLIAAGVAVLLMVLGVAFAPAAAAWSSNDRAFVRAVRHDAPAFKYIAARDLIGTAKETCRAMRNTGASPVEMAEFAIDNGFTENQAIVFVAGSVAFYCPDLADY